MSDIASSNSLADLAGRIKAEHTAVSTALKDSVRHAIAAGELLIEAKNQVPHGQWLPWLQDHCSMSERTAQLYMRVAKNRAEIEVQMRNDVADLTLNEAAAMLALSSDIRKLFQFTREIESLDGEDIIKACLAANIPVIVDHNYNPLAGRSDEEKREWYLFMLFIARLWRNPRSASGHVEWVLQRPFQNVAEWLGSEGDKFRARCGMRLIPDAIKKDWSTFATERKSLSVADVIAELEELEKAPRQAVPRQRRRRGGAA